MKCLSCHSKTIYREKIKNRAFCNSKCQQKYYIGYQNNPDVVGIESSEGTIFKIRLEEALKFETLKYLIQDVGVESVLPLPNIDNKTILLLFKEKKFDNLESETFLKLLYAVQYLHNDNILFDLIPYIYNHISKSKNKFYWIRQFKDIMPLVFVESCKTRIDILNFIEPNSPIIKACTVWWEILVGKKLSSCLKYFTEIDKNILVVKYLIERKNVYSSKILRYAYQTKNTELYKYILSNPNFVQIKSIRNLIHVLNDIENFKDILNIIDLNEYVDILKHRLEYHRLEDSDFFLFLIKTLIESELLEKNLLHDILCTSISEGFVKIVEYLMKVTDFKIFGSNILVTPENCLTLVMLDDRFIMDQVFFDRFDKNVKVMNFIALNEKLRLQCVPFIKYHINLYYSYNLEKFILIYNIYPDILNELQDIHQFYYFDTVNFIINKRG